MYEIQSVTADSIKTMCSVELEAVCFRWKKDIETAQFNLNSVEPLIPQRRNQEVIARKKKQDEQIELEKQNKLKGKGGGKDTGNGKVKVKVKVKAEKVTKKEDAKDGDKK